MDTDIPTKLEAKLFCTTIGKLIWVILQTFFYALRPLFVNPKTPSKLEYVNTAIQLTFNFLVWKFFGKNLMIIRENTRQCH